MERANASDPVQISNHFHEVHPVEFFGRYRDHVTGFEGKATSLSYLLGENTPLVALTGKRGEKVQTFYFSIYRLEAVDGARLSLDRSTWAAACDVVTAFGTYRDWVTEEEGKACAISYSANKCVQVELGLPNPDTSSAENPGRVVGTDVQNLAPVGDSKDPGLTSETAPGSPRASLSTLARRI